MSVHNINTSQVLEEVNDVAVANNNEIELLEWR